MPRILQYYIIVQNSISYEIKVVIIEDTLSMFKEFISSQTVRKNYYPPEDNLESDWL